MLIALLAAAMRGEQEEIDFSGTFVEIRNEGHGHIY